ncbi:uncharacterized protein LOC135348337 [Halichondria panicea]|uniref:uncharacterized protein LOC135348337 n=1 Tax=Halichondria panicea TaxID=6063 RepID=UPI00312B8FF4
MPCCKCNRTGSCRGCVCVKAKRPCANCLPSKLGNYSNPSATGPSSLSSQNQLLQPLSQLPVNLPANQPPYQPPPSQPSVSQPDNLNLRTQNQQWQPVSQLPVNLSANQPPNQSPPSQPSVSQPENLTANQPNQPPQREHSEQVADLPSPSPTKTPVFSWGVHSATDFCGILEATYTEVIHWRKNSFTVPFGKAGKEFVDELSNLYAAFASASALESVALKAATVLPILSLQKPHRASKNKENSACLTRRLNTWKEGNLNDLLLEGRTIQRRLRAPVVSKYAANQSQARLFANKMFAGKCGAALDILADNREGGVLHLADRVDPNNPNSLTVREALANKHPKGQPPHPNCILPSPPQEVHPVVFDALDASSIRSAALHTSGSAGPSGLDAYQWRRLCTSFKRASDELCHQLAMVARRLCTSYVAPPLIAPFLACRLIALDKNPGVRPIGIGDTARRIIAKATLSLIKTTSKKRQAASNSVEGSCRA